MLRLLRAAALLARSSNQRENVDCADSAANHREMPALPPWRRRQKEAPPPAIRAPGNTNPPARRRSAHLAVQPLCASARWLPLNFPAHPPRAHPPLARPLPAHRSACSAHIRHAHPPPPPLLSRTRPALQSLCPLLPVQRTPASANTSRINASWASISLVPVAPESCPTCRTARPPRSAWR